MQKKKIKVLFLASYGTIHNCHGYLNEIASYPDIDVTALVPPYWPYERSGTSTWNSVTGKYKKVYADRYYKKSDRRYNLIKKCPLLPGKSFHIYPGLFRFLSKMKPDVIHMFMEPWYATLTQVSIWRNLFSKNTKLCLYSHDNIYRPYRNRLFYNLIIYKLIEDFNMKYLDGSTAVTEEVKGLLKRKGLKGPIDIVGNQIDVHIYKKKKVGALKKKLGLQKKKVIGYFSRIEKEKGVLLLIEAVAKIKNHDIKLIISGWSDENFQEEMMQYARNLDVEDKILLVLERLDEKIVDYINCCDLVVVPSMTTPLWKEQFGRINGEAMACEVPVVGSSSGSMPEVIGDGGLIFKDGDVNDLKNKMLKLLNNEPLRKKLSKLARKRVLNNYSTEKTAELTVEFYHKLVKN